MTPACASVHPVGPRDDGGDRQPAWPLMNAIAFASSNIFARWAARRWDSSPEPTTTRSRHVVAVIAGNGTLIGNHRQRHHQSTCRTTQPDRERDPQRHHQGQLHPQRDDQVPGGTGIAATLPSRWNIERNKIGYTDLRQQPSVGCRSTNTMNAMTNSTSTTTTSTTSPRSWPTARRYTLSNSSRIGQMGLRLLHNYEIERSVLTAGTRASLDERPGAARSRATPWSTPRRTSPRTDAGTNTITDNPASDSSSVISMAGIEATYAEHQDHDDSSPELLGASASTRCGGPRSLPIPGNRPRLHLERSPTAHPSACPFVTRQKRRRQHS